MNNIENPELNNNTKPPFWPSGKQWRQFFNIASRREKYLLFFFGLILLGGIGILGTKYYLDNTKIIPGRGGSLTIAMVGFPRFLNPVLNQINNLDRDLTPVFFSSLLKYNNDGNLVNDLADHYDISEDGKTYTIVLKKDVKWHDGEPLNINDVVFTLETIKNQEYKSPLRTLWQGVDFEKIDEQTINFTLKNSYAPFIHTLTFSILPKHLWEDVTPAQFPLKDLNLKPVGSGPYQFSRYFKDTDGKIVKIETKAFDDYFQGQPHISSLNFQFFDSETEAISSFKRGSVDAISFISASNKSDFDNSDLAIYSIQLPRYFAVFFNQAENPSLADKNIRQALAYATNKQELIDLVLNGEGKTVNSPLLRGMTGYSDQVKNYEFNQDKARNILAAAGWKKIELASTTEAIPSNATSTPEENPDIDILRKDGNKLEITLTTNDWPELTQTAQILATQWAQIGVKTNIEIKETAKIQNETIRPRQFQALLFGEVLGVEPDPFSFWHSSQAKDPGLNLSGYSNADADKILLDAHQDMNRESRAEKYRKFEDLVAEDLPALFLYNPDYLLAVSKKVKGIEFKNLNNISTYLNDINSWFINTSRTLK